MSDPSGSTTWNYDARGRVITETKVINGTGGGTFKTAWSYDLLDRVAWMKYPGGNAGQIGEQVNSTYSNQGLVSNVAGTSTYLSSASYDAAGRPELLTLPGSNLRMDYVYFPWEASGGRMQQIKSGSTGSPTARQDLRYTYDAVGNVLSIQDWKAGSPQTQSFSYEFLDRLVSAGASGGTGGTYSQTYAYNVTGNLTFKTGVGTYTYPAVPPEDCQPGTPLTKPHAVSAAGSYTFSYDCNGNMTGRNIGTSYTLSYDAENRLTAVSGGATASFVYDGDGNRVKATVAGVTTVYVGNHYELSGITITKYYYAGGQRVAMRIATTLRFLLGDHLGSTAITANSTGGLVAEVRYYPWGGTRYTSGTTPTSYRFTGQRQESALDGLERATPSGLSRGLGQDPGNACKRLQEMVNAG